MEYDTPQEYQTFVQLSKQELKKLQDQEFSYNIMCILLNSLEGYALEQEKEKLEKRKFGGYDHFNSIVTKDKLRLKKQLIFHLRRMKDSYELYIEEHGVYEFPKKLVKEQIKSDVRSWMLKVPKEDQKYYSAFIDLLDGKEIPNFKEDLISIPSNAKPGQSHANNFMEAMVKINFHAGEKEKHIQEEYEKNGCYQFEPKLYEKPQSDPYLGKMNIDLNKENSKDENLKEVYLGEKGNLLLDHSKLYFINYKNDKIAINGIDKKDVKNNNFIKHKNYIIYIIKINDERNAATCILFNPNNVAIINKKDIQIKGTKTFGKSSYNYGTTKEKNEFILVKI